MILKLKNLMNFSRWGVQSVIPPTNAKMFASHEAAQR